MNKYSHKIIKHIDDNYKDVKISSYENNEIIKQISELFVETKNIPLLKEKEEIVLLNGEKINNKKYEEMTIFIEENKFMADELRKFILSTKLNYEKYENENIKIQLLYQNDDKPNISLIISIHELIKKLCKYNENKKEKMLLLIFYISQKKYFPTNSGTTIGPIHVNSGSTLKNNYIMIWRKEDFYKVLIHEMIHFYNFDFDCLSEMNSKLKNIFNKYFKIENDNDALSESYVEVLALTIHSVIMAKLFNKHFDEVFSYEYRFALFQTAKILYFWNLLEYDDIFTHTIKQNTSVFSYYIIKLMFLMNYDKLLTYWKNNGFVINNDNDIFIQFYEYIIMNKTDDIKVINKMIGDIKNIKNKDRFVYKTLRMSVYQIQ